MRKNPFLHTDDRICIKLDDIPNVGKAIAADLRLIGIDNPADLAGRDPFVMYDDLCRITAIRHDPCVIDVFMSAVSFMNGDPARHWWEYTAERKRRLSSLSKSENNQPDNS